jgi:uncharacterized protein with HEPN domain
MPHRKTGGLIDPKELQGLGQKASHLHLHSGIPLSDAVVKVARWHGRLNPEQVRRVIEFTNNEAFQTMFKQAEGSHRVVCFPGGPADPSQVLKELSMDHGVMAGPGADRYLPGMDSTGDIFAQEKAAALSQPLGLKEKRAHVQWQELQRMNDHFVDAYRTAQRDYDDAVGELCKEARGLVNDGGSTTDLVRALGRVEHLDGMAKLALRHISDDWENRCMTVDQDPMMSKRAHMVRVKHPFIQAFFDFEKVALERFKIAAALEYVGEEIKNVSKQLRDEVR